MKKHQYQAKCSCRSTSLTFATGKSLKNSAPRACDCDFCTAYQANYISDSTGSIHIITDQSPIYSSQGSNQAKFIQCRRCLDLVGVCFDVGSHWIGALNASLLDSKHQLPTAETVSTQNLSGREKVMRWGKVWGPVTVNIRKK